MRTAPGTDDHHRPLRVAVLVKQVPRADALQLRPDGRLLRHGTPLEMNAHCRRAVAKGVALAVASGGSCTAFTLGPPEAEEVLRETVAWGADQGIHLCDAAFAGSDTLATARALAAALRDHGSFDLVLAGRSSLDGATGQVAPELAALLDLPFAAGARRMRVAGRLLELGLEHDEGWREVMVTLPAVVSVAERLCDPCKVDVEGRAAVPAHRIRRVTAGQLGGGPWGTAASRTQVGAVRVVVPRRQRHVLTGDVEKQVRAAVALLVSRAALGPGGSSALPGAPPPVSEMAQVQPWGLEWTGQPKRSEQPGRPAVAAILEPGHPPLAAELLGAAAGLSRWLDGEVVGLSAAMTGGPLDRTPARAAGWLGADEVVHVRAVQASSPLAADDVAGALADWARERRPSIVLAPGTAYGCEVASRMAAALDAGLVGDAVALDVRNGRLVAGKPACSGMLLADITCTSAIQLVTVRPGVLPLSPPLGRTPRHRWLTVQPRNRLRTRSVRRDDDLEALARAEVVVGVGAGVRPDHYGEVRALARVLGAELGATRKVTDRGWAPHSRQLGITGRSIAPRLYVAVGLSGSLNHMVGVQAAGTVLAINTDHTAPVFQAADVGIVGDWAKAVPLLTEHLTAHLAGAGT